ADPVEIGPVDIVLFCIKLYDVEEAAALCRPLIGEDTAVISLLNGVDAHERMAPILGAGHVVGGIARISSQISAPGVFEHKTPFAELEFSEADSQPSPRLQAFEQACAAAGIAAQISSDIEVSIWQKFVMLSSIAGVACLTRQANGVVKGDPDLLSIRGDAVREAIAVARARGVALPDDCLEKTLKMQESFPDQALPSMWFDLDAGKRMELEGLTGVIVRLGRELAVPTPVNRAIYAALKPFANGANA
ncbi:MAG: 2-dehydropantoate 2-reductase, partial [Rhodospirillaceae bacterium]|nr:2-dehydropantoate 2-reductase [Rhodospirillaceae bacterium]